MRLAGLQSINKNNVFCVFYWLFDVPILLCDCPGVFFESCFGRSEEITRTEGDRQTFLLSVSWRCVWENLGR